MTELTLKQFAQLGGQASVKSRFKGLKKEEISEVMRKVRLSKVKKEKI